MESSSNPEVAGYHNLELIGAGGFAVVYRARQDQFDREVALKVLHIHLADETARRRFDRECRITGRIGDHPHVVSVFDSGSTLDGRPYIATALMSGGSLAERVQHYGTRPVEETLDIGVKLCSALATAHAASILHRDIKPENVLISAYGEPALADFGISASMGPGATAATNSFTPLHAAPELLLNETGDATSDVYSLASTLYYLLAGRAPYQGIDGEGLYPLMQRILNDPVPPIGRSDVPATLVAALDAALAKSPAQRTPSATELAQGLLATQTELGLPRSTAPFPGAIDGLAVTPGPAPFTASPPTPGAMGPHVSYVFPNPEPNPDPDPDLNPVPDLNPAVDLHPDANAGLGSPGPAVAVPGLSGAGEELRSADAETIVRTPLPVLGGDEPSTPTAGPRANQDATADTTRTTSAPAGAASTRSTSDPKSRVPLVVASVTAVLVVAIAVLAFATSQRKTEDPTVALAAPPLQNPGTNRTPSTTPPPPASQPPGSGPAQPLNPNDTGALRAEPDREVALSPELASIRLMAVMPTNGDPILALGFTAAGQSVEEFQVNGGSISDQALLAATEVMRFDRHSSDATTGMLTEPSVLAGKPTSGFAGDGGLARDAQLGAVRDVAVSPQGRIVIADKGNHRLRMIDEAGVITTIAGGGEPGTGGDGGPATEAQLFRPEALDFDAQGNLYVFDSKAASVRMIDTTGTISYVAGSELTGKVPDYYEGLDVPIGGNVTVDHDGNIYVATSADGVIRKRLRSGEIQELGSVKWPFGRMAIGKDNSLLMLQTAAPAAAGVTGQQAMPDEPQLELVTFLSSGERSEPRRITGMPKVGLCEDLITTNGGTAYFSCGANIYRIDNI